MIDFNTTILVLAVICVIALALVNVIQIIMAHEGQNPLDAGDSVKFLYVILMLAIIALFITHIITAMGDNGVGIDEPSVLIPGWIAIIFAAINSLIFIVRDGLDDNATWMYFLTLAIVWVSIIVHIIARCGL